LVVLSGYYDLNKKLDSELDYYEDHNSLLDIVDAVIISVPPKFSPEFTKAALERGVHVFCEKPAAITVQDLRQVGQAKSKAPGSILAYGFNHRRHRSVIKMKEFTEDKTYGQLLWMRGRYGKEVEANYQATWRNKLELNGGGILIDQGIHMIDLMHWIAGGFDIVTAVMSNNYFRTKKVEDNAFVTLASSKSKISASMHSTITQWRYLFALELFFEKGSAVLNGLRTSSGVYGEEILTFTPNKQFENDFDQMSINYNDNHSWRDEMSAFVNSILNQTEYPYTQYQDALETTKLIERIYKNAIWV